MEIDISNINAPMWMGTLTDKILKDIISGLLIPNQAMATRIAYELHHLRKVCLIE